MEFKEKLSTYVAETEQAFETLLPPEDARPSRIHQAMRYSLSAGGNEFDLLSSSPLANASIVPETRFPLP